MRSLGEAQKCWAQLDDFTTLDHVRTYIKEHGTAGPSLSGLRSVCWKAFLLFNSLDRDTWSSTLQSSRTAYQSLREHLLKYIENPNEVETAVDPLSESEESPWVALRKDEELRNEIYQDVERCMPENLYFRQPSTSTMLLDILFIFCKLSPDIGYKQGMHEILAPILWVVERDAVDCGEEHGNEDLAILMFDAKFVEHDCFTLFGLIMQGARSFYEVPGADAKPTAGLRSPKVSRSLDSPLIVRIKRVYEDYLPLVDPRLAEHLSTGDVVPQLFMMKWLRLLFGREFPFDS
ncbi:RabGAP/TBC, partial [Eremomyces bilateralis CBS 781.70]